MHCVPVSRAPVMAETALQVKMDTVNNVATWGFDIFNNMMTFGSDLFSQTTDSLLNSGILFGGVANVTDSLTSIFTSYMSTLSDFKTSFG